MAQENLKTTPAQEKAAAFFARPIRFGPKSVAILEKEAVEAVADGDVGYVMPDRTVYAGISPETGKPMYTPPGDEPVPQCWDEALKTAREKKDHGHNDWRVPTWGELGVLFNSRAAIGGLKGTPFNNRYWSSSALPHDKAWAQYFDNGQQGYTHMYHTLNIRCVRG